MRLDVAKVNLSGRDSKCCQRELVVHPGAVLILPFVVEHTVIMIRNERFAVGQTLWELPAGTLEPPPETPRSCAARELAEETGYQADKISPMLDFYTTPGFCNERMWAFVATDLTAVGQKLDTSEKITVEAVAYDRSIKMVHDGEITDGKTIASLLYYDRFIRNQH